MTVYATAPDIEVPVLIVGAGPAGLACSNLLSRYGVEHLLVEKYAGTSPSPRASVINQRTVEIFRHLGLEQRLSAVSTPVEMMANTVWTTSLAGLEVARTSCWGMGPDRQGDYRRGSPSTVMNCPQTVLEPLLLEAAQEHPQGDLRFRHEFVSMEQDDVSVTALVLDKENERSLTVRCQYLIGADGARSRVVEQAGLVIEGETNLGAALTIWFKADLAKYIQHRPGALFWNVSPGVDTFPGAGVLFCHKPWNDFVVAVGYDPAEPPPHTEEWATERIRELVGDATVEPEIHGFYDWVINHQVAATYSSGRVFCMGDAVHRHPPTNGLGLNTSIADAYNLAWKLSAVLKGDAGTDLLDTYSTERQPVGRQAVDRAFQSAGEMAAVPQAIGFVTGQSQAEGEAALDTLYSPGPEGEARRRALSDALALMDYQFNAQGVELGYRYRGGASVGDGTPEPGSSRDPELYYDPTTWPGAHLPHAWLDDGQQRVSTLDLVPPVGFSLLTGIGGDDWSNAAATAARELGVPVEVHQIGTRSGPKDVYGDWAEVRGVSAAGAILVRPDRHVAWRSEDLPDVASKRLIEVLRAILCQDQRSSRQATAEPTTASSSAR